MLRKYLLIVNGMGEMGTGLLLLFIPLAVFTVLLGVSSPTPEAIFVGRIAGAALMAMGVACWLARNDQGSLALRALLTGVLLYDLAAAGLLAYAGAGLKMVGWALWPAVGVHAVLAVWVIKCLQMRSAESM